MWTELSYNEDFLYINTYVNQEPNVQNGTRKHGWETGYTEHLLVLGSADGYAFKCCLAPDWAGDYNKLYVLCRAKNGTL